MTRQRIKLKDFFEMIIADNGHKSAICLTDNCNRELTRHHRGNLEAHLTRRHPRISLRHDGHESHGSFSTDGANTTTLTVVTENAENFTAIIDNTRVISPTYRVANFFEKNLVK